eukprot:scaffold123896_cov69-Phaeocystis_antarctica.AAC.1
MRLMKVEFKGWGSVECVRFRQNPIIQPLALLCGPRSRGGAGARHSWLILRSGRTLRADIER